FATRAQNPDFFDQLAAKRLRIAELAIAFRLWDIVGGSERKGVQADLRVATGQGGDHEHDEIAPFLQQKRKRGDSVQIRHGDVENKNVWVFALDLLDGLACAAQRSDDLHA